MRVPFREAAWLLQGFKDTFGDLALARSLQQGCPFRSPAPSVNVRRAGQLVKTGKLEKAVSPVQCCSRQAGTSQVLRTGGAWWQTGLEQGQCLPKGLEIRCPRGSVHGPRTLLGDRPSDCLPWSGSQPGPRTTFKIQSVPQRLHFLPHRHHNIIASTRLDGNCSRCHLGPFSRSTPNSKSLFSVGRRALVDCGVGVLPRGAARFLTP
jgi:hypothetical protein